MAHNAKVPAAQVDDYCEYCMYDHVPLGDPEMPMWTKEPALLQVTHSNQIQIGTQNFSVTVKNQSSLPIENAMVCLMAEDVYERGYTNASGQVNLSISPSVADTLWVTVTTHNFIPYEGYALIQEEGVAYLKHEIIDTISPGNSNGEVNPAEVIDLIIWVKNYKAITANNVGAGLIISDTLIDLISDWTDFGNIPAGDSASGVYKFSISLNALDGHMIACSLTVFEGLDEWVSTFSIPVIGIPEIQVTPPFLSFYYEAKKGDVDTLIYDNGNPANSSNTINYVAVRFTPASLCSIRAGLLYTRAWPGVTDTMLIFDDAGGIPGSLIDKVPFYVQSEGWYYVPLSIAYTDANNFWICLRRMGGRVFSDNQSNCGRSFYSDNGISWNLTTYNVLTRAEVKYYTPTTDSCKLWVKASGSKALDVDSIWIKNGSPWIPFVYPTSLYIPSYDSGGVTVGIDTTGLLTNTEYWDTILISSNAISHPLTEVPIRVLISTHANTPPIVSGVPDQDFLAGNSVAIALDDYGQDTEDPDFMIGWDYTIVGGADSLWVNITSDHVATIGATAHWIGEKEVIFKVTDTQGLSDEDTLIVTVYEPGIEWVTNLPLTYKISLTPTPCAGKVAIRYQLPVAGKVELKIYDVGGRLVETLVDESKKVGYYKAEWMPKRNGIYFCKIKTDSFVRVQKFVVIREI